MQKNYKVGEFYLDDNQMQLLTNDQNTLIIAGAGAGKTLTILGKINYLIDHKICKAENILVISFTNASVNDLKSRINYNINIFTFHKLAIHILDQTKFRYTLCNANLLPYIIQESLINCCNSDKKIILKFLKINSNYEKFLKSPKFKSFCNLIETFINLLKANNIKNCDIFNLKFSNLEKKILIIILNIYKKYIIEKNSSLKLDFDDLIIYSTQLVHSINLNYKYIIIDEFQDTSSIRLNLIKELFKLTNSKIIVVGDDWQSIYRFSGCNLNIFFNFSKIFPNVNEIKLSNTYRNSLELITIASKFIQKNPLQIKKELISQKHNEFPIILAPYINKNITFKKLLNYLLTISKNIIILGRNNNDIYNYIDEDFTILNNILYYKDFEINYYTVHKSKGLEAEYVIVINCNNESLGFPNKIENNSIINKLFGNNEIKFAEERRLFYVALTRCKEQVFLMYNKNNPSIFIKEIKKIIKNTIHNIKYFK